MVTSKATVTKLGPRKWPLLKVPLYICRSCRPAVFCKKGVLIKSFAKFTGKLMCQSLFFDKVASNRWCSHGITIGSNFG